MERPERLAVFVVPRPRSAWKGAAAMWITISGWALAAEKLLGNAVVFTSDECFSADEILKPLDNKKVPETPGKKIFSHFVPVFIKVLAADILLFFGKKGKDYLKKGLFKNGAVAFVWEQHDLFAGYGRKLASKLEVPFILYVHAPVVWESTKWGVKRYAWGSLLEKMEAKSLKKADCVAVVSEEVKNKVIEMGVKQEKILISPMGVNPSLFLMDEKKTLLLREKLGLGNRFVVGWTGSFRKFHGLDILIKGFAHFSANHPEAVLLLVGEGGLKQQMEELVEKLGIINKVIFYGNVDFTQIPEIISIFDVAVVGATKGQGFHYSPLKLREYMAAGKAVIAPNVGEIPKRFEPHQLKLYNVGDILDLSSAIGFLRNNVDERKKIAGAGLNAVLGNCSWEVEVKRVLDFLDIKT